jgi:hypothetical protein
MFNICPLIIIKQLKDMFICILGKKRKRRRKEQLPIEAGFLFFFFFPFRVEQSVGYTMYLNYLVTGCGLSW